jgi:hypothetical protein
MKAAWEILSIFRSLSAGMMGAGIGAWVVCYFLSRSVEMPGVVMTAGFFGYVSTLLITLLLSGLDRDTGA